MKKDLYELVKNVPTGIEITKKELLSEYGFSEYYLRVAKMKWLLEPVSIGVYVKRREGYYFNEFNICIKENRFEEAYDYLKKAILSRTNNNYDNHYRIYLILLEKICDIKDSEVNDDSLLEFDEKIYNDNAYYKYFVEFRFSVMSSDWSNAFKNIMTFGNIEKQRTGRYNVSTGIFFKLMCKVMDKEGLNIGIDKEKRVAESNKVFMNRNKYWMFYKEFNRYYQNEEYEKALESLQECLKFADYKNVQRVELLIQLLETYIKLSKKEMVLRYKKIDYQYTNGDYVKLFWDAMNNQDYLMAFRNVGKCYYYNSANEFLKLYREILHKMRDFYPKEEMVPLQGVIRSEKQEIFKECKKLNYDEIFCLVESRKYREIIEILEEYGIDRLSSSYRDIYFIARDLINLVEGKLIRKREIPPEKLKRYSSSCFLVALKHKDYEKAYKYLNCCMPGVIEFQKIYEMMLNDILKMFKIKANYAKIYNFDSWISRNGYINIDKIGQLLEERIDFSKDNSCVIKVDATYEKYLRDLIEILDLTLKKEIDISLMGGFVYDDQTGKVERIYAVDEEGKVIEMMEAGQYNKDNLVSKFFVTLDLMDYYSALQIVSDPRWDIEIANHPKQKYLKLYKFVLDKIKSCSSYEKQECNKKISGSIVDENLEDLNASGEIIAYRKLLTEFKNIIKNKKRGKPVDYEKAWNYYHDNLNGKMFLDKEDDALLHLMLEYLSRKQNNKVFELYGNYKQAYKNRNVEEARKYLVKYQDLIKDSQYDRCLDYHYEKIDALEEDLKRDDFEELYFLYQWGLYYFNGNRFRDCVEVLDKYISLKPSLAFLAYILQGKAYEKLNEYDKAFEKYEKVLENGHNAEAYIRLGNIYFRRRNYEKALEYYSEFRKRKPYFLVRYSRNMIRFYEKVGDKEKSHYYRKLLDRTTKHYKKKHY